MTSDSLACLYRIIHYIKLIGIFVRVRYNRVWLYNTSQYVQFMNYYKGNKLLREVMVCPRKLVCS